MLRACVVRILLKFNCRFTQIVLRISTSWEAADGCQMVDSEYVARIIGVEMSWWKLLTRMPRIRDLNWVVGSALAKFVSDTAAELTTHAGKIGLYLTFEQCWWNLLTSWFQFETPADHLVRHVHYADSYLWKLVDSCWLGWFQFDNWVASA